MSAPVFRDGQKVWHKSDGRNTGIVTGLIQRANSLTYFVRFPNEGEAEYYACELTATREDADMPQNVSVD